MEKVVIQMCKDCFLTYEQKVEKCQCGYTDLVVGTPSDTRRFLTKKKLLLVKTLNENHEMVAEKEDSLTAIELSYRESLDELEQQRITLEEQYLGKTTQV